MTDEVSRLTGAEKQVTALRAFIEARIEEDERIARTVAVLSPTSDDQFCAWMTTFVVDPSRYIVAVDYQRVLAECAAKRRIIAAHLEAESRESQSYGAAADYTETVMRELAGVYADHPDYRDEWRD